MSISALLFLIGCGGKLTDPSAEQAFKKCVRDKLSSPANYETDTYIQCGRETGFNWNVLSAFTGTYLKPEKILASNASTPTTTSADTDDTQ